MRYIPLPVIGLIVMILCGAVLVATAPLGIWELTTVFIAMVSCAFIFVIVTGWNIDA